MGGGGVDLLPHAPGRAVKVYFILLAADARVHYRNELHELDFFRVN